MSRALMYCSLLFFTRYLSPASFGYYDIFTRILGILLTVLSLGLPSYLLIDFIGNDDTYVKALIVRMQSIFFFSVIVSSVLMAASFLFVSRFPPFIALTAYTCAVLSYFVQFVDNYLRMSTRFKLLSFSLVASSLLNVSVCFISIVFFGMDYKALVLGYTFSQLFYLWYYFRLLYKKDILKLDLNPDLGILKKSLVFIPNSILNTVLLSTASWMLLYYCGPSPVGLYAVACKFGVLYDLFIAQPLNTLYMPAFFRRLSRELPSVALQRHFVYVYSLIALSIIVLLTPSSTFHFLSAVIPNREYYESFQYISYTLSMYVMLHAIALINMIFMKFHFLLDITVNLVVGSIVCLLLCAWLISSYQLRGALLANWFSFAVILCLSLYTCERRKAVFATATA